MTKAKVVSPRKSASRQRGAKKYVVWGATGQAIVVHEALSQSGWELVAVFDRNPLVRSPFEDVPIFHGEAGFHQWRATVRKPEQIFGVAAIGGALGRDRLAMQSMFRTAGLEIVTVVHPLAWVANDAVLGEGCQVMAQAAVAARAKVGSGGLINTGASVDHECVLGEGVHVCPGAHLAGCIEVGDHVMIGTGAVVVNRVKIGSGAIIGAGAVVLRDVPAGATVVGSPARELVRRTV